ncbi:MAG: SixA phosphatase family protein [Stellaceae bacterium]
MPMLHVLRHAKSSWKDDLADHERPLNRRGRAAGQQIGRHLAALPGGIDLVLCSTAVRTCETLDLALAGFAVRPRCLIEDGLYLADCDRLLRRLRRLGEADRHVLLIGHNPGICDLVLALAEPDDPRVQTLAAGKFPTAARASLRLSTGWPALANTRHRLVDYVTVGSLPAERE